MDGAIVPLTFCCRNAQLCLAKATEAHKAGFAAEELSHLKTFTSLVSDTIPSHPNFRNRQDDKQVLELHAHLPEATKRIRELENSEAAARPKPQGAGGRSRHPKPPLASSRSPAKPPQLESSDNQDEEDRSWNGTSDDTSRSTSHSHHRRKKQQQDEHPRSRGNGLREWKGDFVKKAARVHDEGTKRSRSASAPRRMQGVDAESVDVEAKNPAVFHQGMKEDCEHFRRDMQILTQKAISSRMSLREAEGHEKLHRKEMEDLDRHKKDSPRINTLRGGRKDVESQKSPSATASGSSSGSSITSLSLSHYIQKLKKFSPDSQLDAANLELLTPVNKDSTEKSAIFLPAPMNSPVGVPRQSPRLVENQFVSSAALYTSLAHPARSRLRPSPPESVFASTPELHLTDGERGAPLVTSLGDQLSYPQYQNDAESDALVDGKHEKLNSIQRVLGELKGSVKGMKIRLEVDAQGWRGRVDGLERELENLKEEADDEIIAAKHSLRNEMKVKLSDLVAEMERIRRQERNEVEVMVEERIEKQLKARIADIKSPVDTKDEIRLLWAEMDALVKSRQEMQGHVEHLTSVAQKAQEHASREHEMLKSENGYLRKQLQSLKNEGVQVRLETEDFRMEREDLRIAMDKLKGEGTDMKLEIQSLKKVEKLIKMELENVQAGLTKFQEETQDLERQRGPLQAESGRERAMIMERVESLSQRYLGGLEEVKADVFNVKFHCRDRIQEFENQWSEFRKQKPEASNFASKQMLIDELDHFRREIAEMVEIERGLVRQTFERESEAIQRQVKDMLTSSKGEIMNVLKLDVQKWLQGTHERVFLMTESLKQDLDTLKNELGRTQEGAEDLMQIISAAEIHRDEAAAAATDASMSATKASNVLMNATKTMDHEMQDTHHRIKQFQDNLAVEKEVVASAMYEALKVSQELQKEKDATLVIVQEARQKHKELQDYLERESSRILTALMIVQKERDAASQAASEATSSAMKAREVLAELVETYTLEMAKAQHVCLQHQEGEMATSYKVQDRFSEELELAIEGWKQAANVEISKAKDIADELQKQFHHCSPDNQMSSLGFVDTPDMKSYISKERWSKTQLIRSLFPLITLSVVIGYDLTYHLITVLYNLLLQTEESISGLAAMVRELQECKEHFSEEKKRRVILKQQENERRDGEISQINQVVRVVEKRVLDACEDYTEVRKRLKKCEGAHQDLVHQVKEVSANTSELAKTVGSWLPRYDVAARIVNDLSCKVKRVEEKFEGFGCDEGLVQRISRIAETKVEGLKALVASSASIEDIGQELRDLHERVESSDRVHCQAIGEVATRVAQLEHIRCAGQPSSGLSLKVEYTDSDATRKQGMGSLSQSVEALERKMEHMTEHTGAIVGSHESAIDSRLLGLESRIEHVASATFTNLRLLDSKVDRVSVGMQSAVEGAALAESKCGALGAELVKVFRMLTASNTTSSKPAAADTHESRRSPTPPTEANSCSQSPRTRAPAFRATKTRTMFSPKRRSRVYISKAAHWRRNGEAKGESSTASEEEEQEQEEEEEDGAPDKQSCYYLKTSVNHEPVVGCKVHTQGTQLSVQKGARRAIRLRENMVAAQS